MTGSSIQQVEEKKAEIKQLTQKDIEKTREWQFAVAYIEEKMNGAAAARRVFNMGSRGGKKKNAQSTASQVAREYLIKPEVQGYLEALMSANGAGVHDALKVYVDGMQRTQFSDRLQSADRIMRYHGKHEREPDSLPPIQRHVHLHIPARPNETDL